MRATALLLVLISIAVTAVAGCAGGTDDLVLLARRIPIDLSEDGLLLRRGTAGVEQLVGDLGVDPDAVAATATAGVPALRVLMVAGDGVVTTLEDAGFSRDEPTGSWTVLLRSDGVEGYAGIPAVAVRDDLVAVGDRAQLELLLAGGRPLPLPERALDGAAVALVRGPVAAHGDLPAIDAAVVTADPPSDRAEDAGPGAGGVMAVRLAAPGTQADAVALSVLLRTAVEVTGDGTPVVQVEGALTDDDVVTVDLVWQTAPGPVLGAGIQASPLAVLDG